MKQTHTARHCIVGSRAQASSTPQNHRDTSCPWAVVPARFPSVRLRIHQMVAEPTPDSRCNLASKLSSQLSVTLLSADHLFWAQASSLVIAYCHVACLCAGSASQPAQPSPSPALHGLRLTGHLGKEKLLEPGWAVSWLDSEHWEKLRDISSWGPRGRKQGWGRTKALTASE